MTGEGEYMARVACFCRKYFINPENATYVKNSIPLCHEETCRKVKEHREAMLLRRTPFADETEYDQMPEPYSRSNRYEDV